MAHCDVILKVNVRILIKKNITGALLLQYSHDSHLVVEEVVSMSLALQEVEEVLDTGGHFITRHEHRIKEIVHVGLQSSFC